MDIRYYINLVENIEETFKPISELTPEHQEIAYAIFASLADAQRGRPEILGTSRKANPGMFHATGVFTFMAEHIGDLSNRISADYADRSFFGYEPCLEKLNRADRVLNREYGFEKEMQGNLKNNYQVQETTYDNDTGKETPNPTGQSFEDYVEEFKMGAKAYADAHAKLRVYNKAQWHCRQAAVSLGELKFGLCRSHIATLKARIEEGPEAWVLWASEVIMINNTVKPYKLS